MDVEIPEFGSTDDSILKKVKYKEEVMNTEFEKSTSLAGSSGSLNSDNVNSDTMDHEEDNYEDDDAIDDVSDYDDNDDYMFENDDDDDDYLSMQAQFDNVDLPPGVEASVSWLKGPSPSTSAAIDAASLSAKAGTSGGIVPDIASKSNNGLAGSEGKEKAEKDAQFMQRYEQFKQFDIVDDFSDHYYVGTGFQGQQPPKNWTKKVQDEWKILEKDLPETIYVRVNETRMDLLRAVIVGPAGTPYHDGLFTFDVLFPPTYPDVPPNVYYYSGGLRLNPNLYECGKVCLSLLGTWNGKGCEKWMPNKSTMLQVLVSIQALILNTNPFFNEPGYDGMYPGSEGERRSKGYNEDVLILSLKTMMYTLRRPPKHFEDLVTGHFRTRAHAILLACRAYMEGVQVGSAVGVSVEDREKSGSREFKAAVGRMVNGLVSNFSRHGAIDCEQFRISS